MMQMCWENCDTQNSEDVGLLTTSITYILPCVPEKVGLKNTMLYKGMV